ncbi:hypothetical protein TW65_01801 [Stemphylium lycopersici]|nr:hypothetical protein TW65_01801 [Stemphylium lycopersici]
MGPSSSGAESRADRGKTASIVFSGHDVVAEREYANLQRRNREYGQRDCYIENEERRCERIRRFGPDPTRHEDTRSSIQKITDLVKSVQHYDYTNMRKLLPECGGHAEASSDTATPDSLPETNAVDAGSPPEAATLPGHLTHKDQVVDSTIEDGLELQNDSNQASAENEIDLAYVARPASSSPSEPDHLSKDSFNDSCVFVEPSETTETSKEANQDLSFGSESDESFGNLDDFAIPSLGEVEDDSPVLFGQNANATGGNSTQQGDEVPEGTAETLDPQDDSASALVPSAITDSDPSPVVSSSQPVDLSSLQAAASSHYQTTLISSASIAAVDQAFISKIKEWIGRYAAPIRQHFLFERNGGREGQSHRTLDSVALSTLNSPEIGKQFLDSMVHLEALLQRFEIKIHTEDAKVLAPKLSKPQASAKVMQACMKEDFFTASHEKFSHALKSNCDQIEKLTQSNRARKKVLNQTGLDPSLISGLVSLIESEDLAPTDTTKALKKVLRRTSSIVSYTGLAANVVLSDVEKGATVEKDRGLCESIFIDTVRHVKDDVTPRRLLEDMGIMDHESRLFEKFGMSVSRNLDHIPKFSTGQIVGHVRKALEELYVDPNSCIASLKVFLISMNSVAARQNYHSLNQETQKKTPPPNIATDNAQWFDFYRRLKSFHSSNQYRTKLRMDVGFTDDHERLITEIDYKVQRRVDEFEGPDRYISELQATVRSVHRFFVYSDYSCDARACIGGSTVNKDLMGWIEEQQYGPWTAFVAPLKRQFHGKMEPLVSFNGETSDNSDSEGDSKSSDNEGGKNEDLEVIIDNGPEPGFTAVTDVSESWTAFDKQKHADHLRALTTGDGDLLAGSCLPDTQLMLNVFQYYDSKRRTPTTSPQSPPPGFFRAMATEIARCIKTRLIGFRQQKLPKLARYDGDPHSETVMRLERQWDSALQKVVEFEKKVLGKPMKAPKFKICANIQNGVPCKEGEYCLYKHASETKTCTNIEYGGICPRKNCWYKHSGQQMLEVPEKGYTPPPKNLAEILYDKGILEHRKPWKQLCAHVNSLRGCKHGDDCRFSHSLLSVLCPAIDEQNCARVKCPLMHKSTTPCDVYKLHGGCNCTTDLLYRHPDNFFDSEEDQWKAGNVIPKSPKRTFREFEDPSAVPKAGNLKRVRQNNPPGDNPFQRASGVRIPPPAAVVPSRRPPRSRHTPPPPNAPTATRDVCNGRSFTTTQRTHRSTDQAAPNTSNELDVTHPHSERQTAIATAGSASSMASGPQCPGSGNQAGYRFLGVAARVPQIQSNITGMFVQAQRRMSSQKDCSVHAVGRVASGSARGQQHLTNRHPETPPDTHEYDRDGHVSMQDVLDVCRGAPKVWANGVCSGKERGRAKKDKLPLNHGTEEDETIYLAGSSRQPKYAVQAGTDQRRRGPQHQLIRHASRQEVAKSYE